MKKYSHKGTGAQREIKIKNHTKAQRREGRQLVSKLRLCVLCAFVRSIILMLLFTGCTSLVQKGGDLLEGNAFAEKTLAVYRSFGINPDDKDKDVIIELKELRLKDGEEILEITSSAWPSLALRGNLPGADGSFQLTGARFLSSHVHGWNEFTLDLLGSAAFYPSGKTIGLLRINGEVQRVQISLGKIRLKSSRLTGTAALTPLRNRRERILALTEWMSESGGNDLSNKSFFTGQKEFEDHWKGRLFPELVSKRKRPPEYSTKNAEWGRADSVRWNRSYTKTLFPEGLWEYRNSGALLRDWEEALPWIYMEYSWDAITGFFNKKNLIKIN